FLFFFLILFPRPSTTILFPYTTLFRSIKYFYDCYCLYYSSIILFYRCYPTYSFIEKNGGYIYERGGYLMEWDVFVDAFPYVMEGFKLTVILTIVCYIFALIVGFVWVFLRRIPIRFISWLITWIMEFIRSTPPLVQLFFLYYGLPVLPGVGVSLSAFTCAVIGLGLHFSTYIGEVYRSGIESVDQGQWEASTALNLSTWQK